MKVDKNDAGEEVIYRQAGGDLFGDGIPYNTEFITNKDDYLIFGNDIELTTDDVVKLIEHLNSWLYAKKLRFRRGG